MGKFIVHVNNGFDDGDIIEVKCDTEHDARVYANEKLRVWNHGVIDDLSSYHINYIEEVAL